MTLDEPVRRYLDQAVRAVHAPAGVRLAMAGRVRVGVWLPFRAQETCDGRSFTWRARLGRGALEVVDRFADGTGSTEGRLAGRVRVFGARGPDVDRSAAGRAALEAVLAPASLRPEHGVTWRAESDTLVVATRDVPPERPEVRLRIGPEGALRAAWAQRWAPPGEDPPRYAACGCLVEAERRFGDLVVPSRFVVGWWYGTPRFTPSFRAEVTALSAAPAPGPA